MRTSIAWPDAFTASWRERQRFVGGDPQLQLHEVEPVTSSVTGCSTCRRVFISMK
jgi:hypothetical protein